MAADAAASPGPLPITDGAPPPPAVATAGTPAAAPGSADPPGHRTESAALAATAERARPARLAAGGATWRGLLFLLLNLPLGLVGFVFVTTMLALGVGLAVTVIGLPVLAVGLWVCRGFGAVERARARWLLGLRIPAPSRPPRRRVDGLGATFAALGDPVAWRHALYLFIRLPWSIISFVAALVLVTVGWVVLPWATRALVAVDRAMIRGLLSPSESVERRIRELEGDRGTLVDSAAADLRRIERDLHDGAQARLVTLAMGLGMAKEKLADDPHAAAQMVAEAHGEAKLALQELRDLARGINPAILTDRGLPAALVSLAARCTVPTRAAVTLDSRPAAAVETMLYFAASELLTNISKHSRAEAATVELRRVDGGATLVLEVGDNGVGGVDPRGGSGIAGLTERVDAVDGTLVVDSPPGGPTLVSVTVPWRESTELVEPARR
ncbi:Signal transduction histidine kinase [Frankia canadensis]|uniref:histidine kinase n=1 Tax=Frankia canadensis TaxID=1836972 RepID=A0A2I2KMJ5_9ACTN|nr:sensor histidine kinase [Frankia canadensis]SNQ46869.1 Signal transduction histidine kinase [Frankia canadensis]SOU54159.1 Signal transduction histidine kinase [Frankia canadensis]